MDSSSTATFVRWFQNSGASFDQEAMDICVFPPAEGGRGAVALKDLPEGHVLFTIPRAITLSTRTSTLPEQFGLEEWKRLKLHQGWAGLMLCMMWEAARGKESSWSGYLDILPEQFETPMFWNEAELSELEGTSIIGKLGKDDAERDYESKIIPAIKARPALFNHDATFYTIEKYHMMGSRILSRSFTVERWEEGEDGEDEEEGEGESSGSNSNEVQAAAEQSHADAMDVDEKPEGEDHVENGHESDDDDEEDEADASDIAMVPMADMLNARYGTENAKLFHEKDCLKMISTKPIKQGEQIWNTYGDLPNAELLRRYGHVDLLPLADGRQGNPGDVAELAADSIVHAVQGSSSVTTDVLEERIDWWLEEGGDDVFELELDLEFPPAALSLIKLLLFSDGDWQKARDKGKPPKPKAEPEVLEVLKKALERRCTQYPTTIQEDEARLRGELSFNTRNAIIVRLGEKYILQAFVNKIQSVLQKPKPPVVRAPKRKANTEGDDTKKRSRR